MNTRTPARHACARCGKKQSAEQMVFSKHNRVHFCISFASCDLRLARNRSRQAERVTA